MVTTRPQNQHKRYKKRADEVRRKDQKLRRAKEHVYLTLLKCAFLNLGHVVDFNKKDWIDALFDEIQRCKSDDVSALFYEWASEPEDGYMSAEAFGADIARPALPIEDLDDDEWTEEQLRGYQELLKELFLTE